MKFTDLKLTDKTVKSLNNFGYTEATEVQEKAIPQIISGNNVIVRSQTGSGKTAAFGIGLMERIAAGQTNMALILVPTRELAVQVCAELRGISQMQQLKIYAVFGGAPINLQLRDLSKRYEILVATPGRLIDICRRGKVNLAQFNSIVLDEADHMLDMGFQQEVLSIMNKLPPAKQVLLFSATVDSAIKKIASRYMPDSEMIAIGEIKVVSTIKEEKVEMPFREKFDKLQKILESNPGQKILVFAKTKRGVIKLRKMLTRNGIEGIGMLQGDMPQARRIKVLNMFKNNDLSTLIATNVASRGLHIDDVNLIINYDEAENKETHLHRVGRTGRMGAEGRVINFFSPDQPASKRGQNRRSGRGRDSRSGNRTPGRRKPSNYRPGDRSPRGRRRSGNQTNYSKRN
jgi:ATP-dependent RNA helicase DeaD